jgi:phage baseplate assembly protein gpV
MNYGTALIIGAIALLVAITSGCGSGAKVSAGAKTVTGSKDTTTAPPPTAAPPPPPSRTSACFVDPGACGYPDPNAGNVGVQAGTALTASGSISVTRPGTVIEGKDITGTVTVSADNVTIRDSRVTVNGAGCGPSDTCGNAAIYLKGPYTLHVFNVELTASAPTTVEHGIRNEAGGTLDLDRVYQHGTIDALCYCGNATIRNSYSKISMSIAGDHLENIYTDNATLVATHNTLLNDQPQTADIFANTNNGSDAPCKNHLTISDNLLAGGGFAIYACAHGTSEGSSAVSITGNRIARCGRGAAVQGGGGTWVCPHGADSFGYFPNGGSFGTVAAWYPNTVWRGNVWDDTGDPIDAPA